MGRAGFRGGRTSFGWFQGGNDWFRLVSGWEGLVSGGFVREGLVSGGFGSFRFLVTTILWVSIGLEYSVWSGK